MRPLRAITISADADREAVIAQGLAGRRDVELVLRCVDRVEALAAVRAGNLDAAILIGLPPWFDPELQDEIDRAGVRLVGVGLNGSGAPTDRVQRLPASAGPGDIVRSCATSVAPAPPAPPTGQPSAPKGKLIAVWGPKGSPGRTTVALGLARELARQDSSTLLIDGDPYGGDLLQMAGVVDDLPTVIWAAQLAGRQTFTAARAMTSLRRTDRSGPILVPGLPRGDLWQEVSPFGWRQLLVVARALFTHTVCDTGAVLETDDDPYATGARDRNHMTITALSDADRVVAVCRADEIGIKNFLWAFGSLTKVVDSDRVVVVAARVVPGEERDISDALRRHIGHRPAVYIRDGRAASRGRRRARNQERELVLGMKALVAGLGGPAKPRGVLSTLGRST